MEVANLSNRQLLYIYRQDIISRKIWIFMNVAFRDTSFVFFF